MTRSSINAVLIRRDFFSSAHNDNRMQHLLAGNGQMSVGTAWNSRRPHGKTVRDGWLCWTVFLDYHGMMIFWLHYCFVCICLKERGREEGVWTPNFRVHLVLSSPVVCLFYGIDYGKWNTVRLLHYQYSLLFPLSHIIENIFLISKFTVQIMSST